MKTVMLLLAGFLFAFDSSAQRGFIMWPTDATTDKINFSESVYRPETDVNILYAKAKKFALSHFRGERDTIIPSDITKTLTCKSSFLLPIEELGERGKGYIAFTLIIWCHQNSYKYNLTDLQHFASAPDGVVGGPLENEKAASGVVLFPRKYWNEQKAKCYYRVQITIEKLKQAMAAETES